MKKIDNFDTRMGAKIKQLREKAGLSQADLAKKLKYSSATTISLMEKGERSIKTKDVMKLITILDTDFKFLFDDEIKIRAQEAVEKVDFKKLVKQKMKELEYLIDNEK
jgi:transcriptional regulator with XRE-family HTH domain